MNRILLLVIGVASGMWMLHDLSPSAKPTPPAASTGCCRLLRWGKTMRRAAVRPSPRETMPGVAKSISAERSTAANEAGAIKAVKYTVLAAR